MIAKKRRSMLTILKLFGKSPFAPLQSHMEKVTECVHLLPPLFAAVLEQDQKKMLEIYEAISKAEHQADLIKHDIRNHMPKSLFLPVDRGHLLEIISTQDNIADKAEDVAVLLTLKEVTIHDSFKTEFMEFLNKNIEAFDEARLIIKEMHELLESSFGGSEAEKVKDFVEIVSFKEHEVDLIQRKLLKILFNSENEMSYATFHVWQRIVEALSGVSNLSENLAFRVRRMLEIK